MKKRLLSLLCIIMLLCLCGCTIHHSNSFVEGIYTNDQFKLRVTAIDENAYKSKNGTNVVEDDSTKRTNKYYELQLLMLVEEGRYIEITLVNLTQTSVKAEPCSYEDDEGTRISPQEIQNRVKYVLVYGGEEYVLEYSDEQQAFNS